MEDHPLPHHFKPGKDFCKGREFGADSKQNGEI